MLLLDVIDVQAPRPRCRSPLAAPAGSGFAPTRQAWHPALSCVALLEGLERAQHVIDVRFGVLG